jgi:hypothetical protein
MLIGAVFSGSFLLGTYWIDPFIPLSAAVGVTLSSTLVILIIISSNLNINKAINQETGA